MERIAGLALVVALVSGKSAGAERANEARALLERAVKALGGAERLARHQAITWKSKGTLTEGDATAQLQDEWSVQGLDRFRWDVNAEVDGRNEKLLLVMSGGKGWGRDGDGESIDVPEELLPLVRDVLFTFRLGDAPLLLRDRRFKLSPLGELKINGKEAVGLKIASNGRPDVDLFFDKETLRPLRGEIRVKVPGMPDEMTLSVYYGAYKEFDGRQYATTITLQADGKELMVLEREDIKQVTKFDAETFARP